MLEVRNIDMTSLINMAFEWLPMLFDSCLLNYSQFGFSMAALWHSDPDIILMDGPITTTTTTQVHAWVTKCIQTI